MLEKANDLSGWTRVWIKNKQKKKQQTTTRRRKKEKKRTQTTTSLSKSINK